MQNIFELKEQAVTETPLLLFDCLLADGQTEHWSTHGVEVGGTNYQARIMRHSVFEIQTASDQGVDGVPRVALSLANADSHFSQIERTSGFKGAKLTVRFVFYDLRACEAASEESVVFQGVCNPPEEITESTFRLSASNRMSMQRILLPPIRIQRRCPWTFPMTPEQRQEAVDGGPTGKYSRFYRCGYSADVTGGSGVVDGSSPFATCGYTKEDCTARGMLDHFGGMEFVPSSTLVRTYGEKSSHAASVQENAARYNDFVPMVYGTAWYNPPIVFARNDGNVTRLEVLLGIGEIQGVLKVLVNDVEIPPGQAGSNMTGTGWYNVPALGTRAGGFKLDFLGADGKPAGDPYGSMAYMALVVPNRINDGGSLPRVRVLLQGLKLPVYDAGGTFVEERFTNNSAWVLLDVLRRSGWSAEEVDVASFAGAAAYCDEPIGTRDLNGNPISVPRFQCNLVIQKRRSAGDLIRGIRNGSRLYLSYAQSGAIQVGVENSMALQQPDKPGGSNAKVVLNGGWPAYEFGDGTYGFSGILRRENGEPSLRIWSRNSTDTGNRFGTEFQDELNEYQQDSLSIADADDVAKVGQEVTAPLGTLGIPNYDQASRILKFNLDKTLIGNLYVEFETSVRGLGLRPGHLVTITYVKEGFDRQPFRILKISPGANFATARITAQVHSDDWYSDSRGQVVPASSTGRERGVAIGIPRPIGATRRDANGVPQFGVEEVPYLAGDSEPSVRLDVEFAAPPHISVNGPTAPLLDLAPTVLAGGSLSGGQTLFYGVSATSAAGDEGPLSFLVRAALGCGNDFAVKLRGLTFARSSAALNVYRGNSPAQLCQVATNVPLSSDYVDTGDDQGFVPVPDVNFDHANFYWRFELQPESAATIHSGTTVGNGSLNMPPNRYRGAGVRITRGTGAGQERSVTANEATTATVAPAWDIVPDPTSWFVIAEGSWNFGALASSSPARFAVPNRPGETLHICGRAANVNDSECALELSVVTPWTIGGSGTGDTDVAPAPVFGIGPGRRGGSIEVNGVAFPELTNTRTIIAGTLTLHYWNELLGQPVSAINSIVSVEDTLITLNTAGTAQAGSIIQVDAELMRIEGINNPTEYCVIRGVLGTEAETHSVGTLVYQLDTTTAVMPFPKGFFGSRYSGTWNYPMSLPDARVAGAELFVTNQRGNGAPGVLSLTQLENYGLRTLSGGQYTIQAEGFLAVDQSIAPPLIIDTAHAIRDIFAVIGKAADGPVTIQVNMNGAPIGTVTVPAGLTVSNSLQGFGLPTLTAGARISISILSVGQTYPGADLTVVIRL